MWSLSARMSLTKRFNQRSTLTVFQDVISHLQSIVCDSLSVYPLKGLRKRLCNDSNQISVIWFELEAPLFGLCDFALNYEGNDVRGLRVKLVERPHEYLVPVEASGCLLHLFKLSRELICISGKVRIIHNHNLKRTYRLYSKLLTELNLNCLKDEIFSNSSIDDLRMLQHKADFLAPKHSHEGLLSCLQQDLETCCSSYGLEDSMKLVPDLVWGRIMRSCRP